MVHSVLRINESWEMCLTWCHACKTKQITKLAGSTRSIINHNILNHCWLSLLIISQSIVSKLCSLFISHCMLLCKTGLFWHMCHSYSHDIIPIPIPISIAQKLNPSLWDSHGNIIPMKIPIPMHTSTMQSSNLHQTRSVGTKLCLPWIPPYSPVVMDPER